MWGGDDVAVEKSLRGEMRIRWGDGVQGCQPVGGVQREMTYQ
jgi:hypothetical protein